MGYFSNECYTFYKIKINKFFSDELILLITIDFKKFVKRLITDN